MNSARRIEELERALKSAIDQLDNDARNEDVVEHLQAVLDGQPKRGHVSDEVSQEAARHLRGLLPSTHKSQLVEALAAAITAVEHYTNGSAYMEQVLDEQVESLSALRSGGAA